MAGYIEGYRKAACILYEKVIESGMRSDCIFFPYAFQWRYHPELALKNINVLGRQLKREALKPKQIIVCHRYGRRRKSI